MLAILHVFTVSIDKILLFLYQYFSFYLYAFGISQQLVGIRPIIFIQVKFKKLKIFNYF